MYSPDVAIMRAKVDDPSRLNARVVVHIGEEIGKYTTSNVRSFHFERITNGVGNFSMTLVDNNWVEIERAILNAKGKGWFEYGYENALGKPVQFQIVGLELEPYLNYVVLNITGLCLGTRLLENSTFMSNCQQNPSISGAITSTGVNINNRTLSDFVVDLAKAAGYTKFVVDPTVSPVIKENLFGTEDVHKVFNSKGMNLFTFIVRKLLPYAISPEDYSKVEAYSKKDNLFSSEPLDVVPFVFFISLGSDGKEEFHFHRQDKYKYDVTPVATFNLYSDPDTRFISYKPSFEHMLANITRGTSVFAWTYNPLSGTEFEEKGLIEQSPSAINPYFDYVVKGTYNTNTNSPMVSSKVLLYSPDPMLNKLSVARALQMSSNAPLTAELVLTGDPNYNICDSIDINVNIPFGDSRGNPHDTSNRYMVLGIADDINLGVFTTSLQLGTAHGSTDRGKEAKRMQDSDKQATEKAKVEEYKNKLIEETKKETSLLRGKNPRR